MQRWETLTALAAVVIASIGALHVPGRSLFTFAALVLLAIVGGSRLFAAIARRKPRASDAAERARLIREQRRRR